MSRGNQGRTARRALVALATLLAAAGGARAQEALAARVNGVGITEARLDRYFDVYLAQRGRNPAAIRNPVAYESLRREALEQLVDEELLWQEARRRKLLASDAQVEEAFARFRATFKKELSFRLKLEEAGFTPASYRKHLKRVLSAQRVADRIARSVEVSQGEVHEFYTGNPARFARPVELHVRRVHVGLAPGAPAERRAEARARAEQALAELRGGKEFAEVARAYSDGPGAADGDLGFVDPQQLPAQVRQAIATLAEGELSEVVETYDGFHVVRVEGRRGGDLVPEGEVQDQIRRYLLQQRGGEAIRARLAALREQGKIEFAKP